MGTSGNSAWSGFRDLSGGSEVVGVTPNGSGTTVELAIEVVRTMLDEPSAPSSCD